jgi:hypothetical protein
MAAMDFPAAPFVGQDYTAPSGVVYTWDGVAWTVGYYDSASQQLNSVGNIVDQVRTLLQDTDNSSGQYRYSTDSIVTNLNQSMGDMYRVRPDLFLENKFVIPVFTVGALEALVSIEQQYISPLIFYVVGLTQARDDEQTQDMRAGVFLDTFQRQLLTAAVGKGP